MKKILLIGGVLLSMQAHAISIDWTGGYRIEYVDINRPTLSEPAEKKNYALHYLYLQPKITASDGINIVSRIDVLGNKLDSYRNSQMGSFLGSGYKKPSDPVVIPGGANVTSENAGNSYLKVSQLYLNVEQEYGSLVVGRAPIDFGMGITHNSGSGAFDHWIDTKDMAGYRFVVDNISFMPILAKTYQENFSLGSTVSEQILVLEYNNKEAGARAGVFHQTRKAGFSANDADQANYPDGDPSTAPVKTGSFKSQTINVFLERKWTSFELRLEASFLTGNTGLQYVNGEDIEINAYAVAGEVLFPANNSNWEYSAKFGMASGDDATTSKYEGYQFDRNYDVAMLMFNHRMGKADFLTTGVLHSRDLTDGLSTTKSADDEAIGNAIYLAPTVKYTWNDKVDVKGTAIYGQLMTNPNNYVDFKKDLGIELDTEVVYRPRERVTWSNAIGIFMPGSAWKAGNNFDNKMNYGFTTKAAITF